MYIPNYMTHKSVNCTLILLNECSVWMLFCVIYSINFDIIDIFKWRVWATASNNNQIYPRFVSVEVFHHRESLGRWISMFSTREQNVQAGVYTSNVTWTTMAYSRMMCTRLCYWSYECSNESICTLCETRNIRDSSGFRMSILAQRKDCMTAGTWLSMRKTKHTTSGVGK